jgi:acetolactate synthase-1/2/3 large subunit
VSGTDDRPDTIRGGTLIARILRDEGVPFVAGVVGGSLHEIVDGLVATPEVRSILTRHERVATDMADGYARTTGNVGVAIAVQGPGAANALAGVANSFKDSVPVLQIVGQVRQSVIGTDTAQELPLQELFAPIAKWSASVRSIERLPETFRRAFTIIRSGRPRPVVVEIPTDVSAAYIDPGKVPYQPVRRRYRSGGDPDDIERAAALLVQASNPVLYAGAGVLFAEAWDELRELAELLSSPVMTTLNAKGVFPEDHPLGLGLGGFPLGLFASRPAVHFARTADVVLAIGNSFKPSATRGAAQPSDIKLIHVDADVTEMNKAYIPEVGIVGDAKLVLRALIDAIHGDRRVRRPGLKSEVVDMIAGLKREWLDEWAPMLTSTREPINPYRLTWDINATVDRRRTIIMHDSGSVRGYLCHHYEAIEPRGFLGFGGMSSMGWTTGAALGAKLGNPDKTVINYIGDGSFGMTGMDFQTAVRHGIPVLTIVVNNHVLNMSMETRRQNFGERYGEWIHLGKTDYAGIGTALGGWSEKVTSPHEIVPALRRALAATQAGQPALLEVIVEPLIPEPILADPRGEKTGRLIARPSSVPQG